MNYQQPARAAVLLLCTFASIARADDQGYTPLFNGRDLAGWVPVNVAPKTFTVRDGMIVCDGKPTGVMRTEKMYENFELELEYVHLVPGGNAGLFVWSDAVTSVGVPFTRSIEVQILDGSESENHTSHGDVFSIHGATMKPDRPHPRGAMRCLPSEKRAKPAGEWNHYRVVCNDGVLKLSVNGKEVSGASECQPRKGYIVLESEGGVVHYRNVRVKELPSTNPKPEQVAKGDEGFKSIYTGVDLAGWRDPANGSAWKPKDWILACEGGGERGDKTLWTEKEYGDFEMIVDFRLPDPRKKDPAVEKPGATPGDGGILLRGSKQAKVPIAVPAAGSGRLSASQGEAAGPADRPAGAWNRFVIGVKGDACTVVLNGQTVAENVRLAGVPSRGPIGLQCPAGPIEFANIYVRESGGAAPGQ